MEMSDFVVSTIVKVLVLVVHVFKSKQNLIERNLNGGHSEEICAVI